MAGTERHMDVLERVGKCWLQTSARANEVILVKRIAKEFDSIQPCPNYLK
jgi:hypothetical protein